MNYIAEEWGTSFSLDLYYHGSHFGILNPPRKAAQEDITMQSSWRPSSTRPNSYAAHGSRRWAAITTNCRLLLWRTCRLTTASGTTNHRSNLHFRRVLSKSLLSGLGHATYHVIVRHWLHPGLYLSCCSIGSDGRGYLRWLGFLLNNCL